MAYQRSPTKAESALLLTACLALPIDCGALHVSQLCVCEREGMTYQRSPTKAESALLLTACLALAIDHLDVLLAKCDATN